MEAKECKFLSKTFNKGQCLLKSGTFESNKVIYKCDNCKEKYEEADKI